MKETGFSLVDKAIRVNFELYHIAKDLARKGFTGDIGELWIEHLPNAISGDAWRYIKNNQYAFRLKIRRAKGELDAKK